MSLQISPMKLDSHNAPRINLKNLLMVLTEVQINSQEPATSPEKLEITTNTQHSTEVQIEAAKDPDADPNLIVFQKNLRKVPQIWIDFLLKDRIQSESTKIVINTSLVLTELYLNLIENCDDDIRMSQPSEQNSKQLPSFQQTYMSQTSLALIVELLNNCGKKLAKCFMDGISVIAHEVQLINETIKKSEIMNSYMLFGMLKQGAGLTEDIITNNIHQKFPHFTQQKCKEFCKYVQRNYEFIELQCIELGHNFIYSRKQMAEYIKQQNQMWLALLKNSEKISLTKIQSQKGETGILVTRKSTPKISQKQTEKEKQKQKEKEKEKEKAKKQKGDKKQKEQAKEKEQEDEKLILRLQNGCQIKVINARACQESWRIFESKDSFTEIFENLKKQIQTSGKNGNQQFVSYGIPTCEFATIGGSLGKCLADINQYQNANQFFVDLSKTAAIYTTISYAMASIPILSYFIIAGGFTYSFYVACSNEATSSFKKFDQIKNFTMSVFGSVGTTLGGILLGQAIIPVPFVGAFVGGVVGGFFGTKGMRSINEFFAKSNFRDIISYMKYKLIADKYWECTHHMLERIGLDQQYFYSHTAEDKESQDTWITGICFCIISFYESRRHLEFNKRKINQHKSKQEKKQQETVKQQDELFVNEFNLVPVIEFLSARKFMIVEHADQLNNFITHLV